MTFFVARERFPAHSLDEKWEEWEVHFQEMNEKIAVIHNTDLENINGIVSEITSHLLTYSSH